MIKNGGVRSENPENCFVVLPTVLHVPVQVAGAEGRVSDLPLELRNR